MRKTMTKMDERFVSKLELHIMNRMLNGEKLYEFIEKDRSTFIVGKEKRATRVRKSLVYGMFKNNLVEINLRKTHKIDNVYFLGFASKDKREMKLTPIGVQIAKEFTV
jgi:hypothetical protein